MYPGAVSCACVVTSSTAGLISGRERKVHTSLRGADNSLGKAQPAVFANTRQVAPAPTASRNRLRVNLVSIGQLYTIEVSRQPATRRAPAVSQALSGACPSPVLPSGGSSAHRSGRTMRLYQAEWCPFSHRVRAKLTELGIDYEIVNVPAATKNRDELEEVAGTRAIPVLVDGERVITDSGEAISYLEQRRDQDPEELRLHRRELSPTVYGTLPLGVAEATEQLREELAGAGIEVIGDLDLTPFTGGEAYRV